MGYCWTQWSAQENRIIGEYRICWQYYKIQYCVTLKNRNSNNNLKMYALMIIQVYVITYQNSDEELETFCDDVRQIIDQETSEHT